MAAPCCRPARAATLALPGPMRRRGLRGAEAASRGREVIGSLRLCPSHPSISKLAGSTGPGPAIAVRVGRVQAGGKALRVGETDATFALSQRIFLGFCPEPPLLP